MIRAQRRSLERLEKEVETLRAERDVFVKFLAAFPTRAVQDELTLRFSRMGMPGCGVDPD